MSDIFDRAREIHALHAETLERLVRDHPDGATPQNIEGERLGVMLCALVHAWISWPRSDAGGDFPNGYILAHAAGMLISNFGDLLPRAQVPRDRQMIDWLLLISRMVQARTKELMEVSPGVRHSTVHVGPAGDISRAEYDFRAQMGPK